MRAPWTVAVLLLALPAAAQEAPAADTTAGVTVAGQAVDDPRESSKFQEYRVVPNGFVLEKLTFGMDREDWSLDLVSTHLGEEDQRTVAAWSRPGFMRVTVGYDQTPHWLSNTGRTLYRTEGGNLLLPDPMQEDLQFRFVGTETVPDPANDEPPISEDLRGYLADARPVDLRFRRDHAFGDVVWWISDRLTGKVNFSQDQRNGTRPLSLATYFGVGGDVSELANPLDDVTRNAAVSLEYAHAAWHVAAEVFASEYTNNISASSGGVTFGDSLIVDNPLRVTDNVAAPRPPAVDPFPETREGFTNNNRAGSRFLYAAPPDNESMWVNLSGAVEISTWGRLVAQFSTGENSQDGAFLPFTLNARAPTQTTDGEPVEIRLGSLAGPAVDRFDGRVDLTLHNVRLSADPLPWLDVEVFTRSYDYDNKTPHYVVTDYVRTDLDLEGIARAALPFAWKKDNTGAELTFRTPFDLDVGVGVERETWDREFRNAPRTEEDILRVAADWAPLDWLDLHAGFRTGERTHDHYDEHHYFGEESYPEGEPTVNAVVEEQRLFDLANRDQDRLDLIATLSPLDRLSLGLQWSRLDNDYQADLGRTEDSSTGWAVDAGIEVNERTTLSVFYGKDDFEYDLDSRYRPVSSNPPSPPAPVPGPSTAIDHPLNDWSSDIDDRTRNYGLELDAVLVPDRWLLGVSASRTESTGRIGFSFVPGEVCRFLPDGTLDPVCPTAVGDTSSFPDVDQELTSLSADLRWMIGRNLSLGLGFLHEKWSQEDWARDVMNPWMGDVDPGAGESVYLGMRIPDYSVNVLRATLTYGF